MTTVMLLLGLAFGVALGAIAMAFLAIEAYDRGYADAKLRRDERRTEPSERHATYRKARTAA